MRPDLAKDHWRGLEFYNSTVDHIYNQTERLYYNASLSFLEYVDISYAGLDLYYGDGIRHALATISASPYVPMINNITISHGAFDGMNFTEIRGEIHIANSSISYNRGKLIVRVLNIQIITEFGQCQVFPKHHESHPQTSCCLQELHHVKHTECQFPCPLRYFVNLWQRCSSGPVGRNDYSGFLTLVSSPL